jgi:ribosomal subunit interface protein
MNITIKSVDFKAKDTLQMFIREKVSKLFNHSKSIIRANVILRKEDLTAPENKLCEIRLEVPGNDHFVKLKTEVFEKSILQAVEKLQKILRRNKNRQIARRTVR